MSSSPDWRLDKNARTYRKLPIAHSVYFAESAGVCSTLEGGVPYREGDAIVTGIQKEQWPIALDKFTLSYEAIPPTKPGQAGTYRKKPLNVLAVKLQKSMSVPVGSTCLKGREGDWLVQYSPGEFGVVASAIFDKTYEQIV